MRTIFLLDIDCFFASVEMAMHPELRGRPLCVGGRRGERGIVLCPNYEARAYGVRTAMPLRTAERLLPPDAAFVRGHHRLYAEYADRVMSILQDFTPDVEQASVDEAYMDVTGCLHFWGGDPLRMAAAVKERIRRDCGMSVSIGIASNRVCAKIASGLRKPDGCVLIPPGGESEFLAPLPVEVIPGVGSRTLPKLHARGIVTVGDVLRRQVREPSAGALFRYLTAVASGKTDDTLRHGRVEHSISRDRTFGADTGDRQTVEATLFTLTERCCRTLRTRGDQASTVTVKVRFSDFTTVQKQMTLDIASANEEEIFPAVRHGLDLLLPPRRPVRLVGVKVSGLSAAERTGSQLVLGVVASEKFRDLHRRIDALRIKHGSTSIRWGITWKAEDREEDAPWED